MKINGREAVLYHYKKVPFDYLIGKTLTSIEDRREDKTTASPDEVLIFHTTEGESLVMYHEQSCCESVYIKDICGDLSDLVGSPITEAEEASEFGQEIEKFEEEEYSGDSHTWTFYKLRTAKGPVTITWYGRSNGYYSESVDFVLVKDGEEQKEDEE